MRILLTGVSVRALAQSAVRAGYDVSCLDFFGDRDLPVQAHSVSMSDSGYETYDPHALVELAKPLDDDALAYVASLENHPDLVARLAKDRLLIGNTPETLEKIRNWTLLETFCQESGIAMPRILTEADFRTPVSEPDEWLLKPMKGGGGHAIRRWDGHPPETGWYVQQRVEGMAASAVFEADGTRCRVLGLSEQLIGRDRFGASGFRYCGNIYPLVPQGTTNGDIGSWVEKTTRKLTVHFGLRGINGLDFIIPPIGNPVLVEVNPRPPASAELMELAHGTSIFAAHMHPLEHVWHHDPATSVYGKAVVFAMRDVTAPDTTPWLTMHRRDIPNSGQFIQAGHPICTVIANGMNRHECVCRLGMAADAVREDCGEVFPTDTSNDIPAIPHPGTDSISPC
ncbi:ATP-grasp domain-containing protein [Pseudodesulfovibrio sp. JC047]|uniref:ATP-grasp domain-containing protein n=1 Tax=Pseudodesulfovibrio sp. JC047 TaxID=2683199 RepID=UPI0013D55191|nr:ATP-grasp domain-containing protein [Pseudodesulfovibrio sp. JC047]NDV19430.1 ATP-grasp domain-containing protein [Pseudodesulfovibrio sp. JC047]